ncbi:MAG: DUF3179 domain-containing (seleno)protein [Planctomycetota bacterium]
MHKNASRPRVLQFRSGGWALLAAGVLCATMVVWALLGVLWGGPRPVGDGRDVSTYGFDLSTCLVERELLVAAGFPRDGLPQINTPEFLTREGLEEFGNELRRAHAGKYLVGSDRVIGVEIDGQARAYPLRVMTWHEVVNDTLAWRPIVVTYSPLSDSAVVFDRRPKTNSPVRSAAAAQPREFGVSGLIYNSNLVLYDRGPDPSLWSQLQFRAIAGPAAGRGERLEPVPAVVVQWGDWQARHPGTTVLGPDRARWKLYKQSYDLYFASEELRFPVSPLPPPGGPGLKEQMLAVQTRPDGAWRVFTLAEVGARAGAGGVWTAEVEGVPVRFTYRPDPPTAWPEAEAGQVQTVNALWFAWYAHEQARTRPAAAPRTGSDSQSGQGAPATASAGS